MPPGRKRSLFQKAAIASFVGILLASTLMATSLLAHKVNVFAWVEGDIIFVEGYFPGGKNAQNSLVEVFNQAGAKLLEGRTNEKGEFSFKTPEKTDLKIVLSAGMEHRNDFTVFASDFAETAPSPAAPFRELQESETLSGEVDEDMRRLEALINRTLDRKLTPVIKLIRDSRREGPTFSEIVGGIGYIFGLVGVALYFSNRKKKEGGQRSAVSGQQDTDGQ